LDINGSNKGLFLNCDYTGLDIAAGKNVDIVSRCHEFLIPSATFDTIISTECFEHDMFYDKSLANIVRILKPGGFFIFTCATVGRPEHGTPRTSPTDSPFTSKTPSWAAYYKNLEESDIRAAIPVDEIFSEYKFDVSHEVHDLRFYGIKKEN